MNLSIELKPHVGFTTTGTRIEHPQYMVVAIVEGDSWHIGYIGKAAAAPFQRLPPFERFAEHRRAEVIQLIEVERDKLSQSGTTAGPAAEPGTPD